MFNEITGRIEQQLASTSYLVGDRITAADVTAVPLVALAWVRRVNEYDPAAS